MNQVKAIDQGAADTGAWRRAGWTLLLGILAAGSLLAWHWRSGFDPVAATAVIAASPVAPLLFLAIHIAASLLFVPRTALAIVAGLAFGLWWGVVWAATGSVLGAVCGFLIARHIHSGLIEPARWARFTAVIDRIEHGGWRMVMLLRLVPVIPHSLGNYALGLTRLRLGPYAFGSLLGQLPLTIAYVELGAGGAKAMIGAADWLAPVAIGIAVLTLSSLVPVFARRYLRRAVPAPEA